MAAYMGSRVLGVFHVGVTSCLPGDFPRYPRASLASVVISDAYGDCTIQFRTPDTGADVQSFFEANLNEGDWTVTASDERAGVIRFRRTSRPRTTGYVQIVRLPGQQTQFQIQLRVR